MKNALERALRAIDDPSDIVSQRSVSGGCISEATYVETSLGRYFLKTHHRPFFHAEAHGLRLLADSSTVGIPEVLAVDEDFILLSWISGNQGSPDSRALGRQLAALHQSQGERFGLDRDNFIGANPQQNTQHDSWVEFFRCQRLEAQAQLARRNGRWNSMRDKALGRLLGRLDSLLPANPPVSLLHGDLWGGNVLGDENGQPYLIDPAVYFGDRETDIAFSQLFGGFSSTFYDTYNNAWPLETGWQERFEIYNLYHLLNHLNLFGEGYGPGVDRILDRFGS